ncbi:hypothetical protein BDB00DRAFT_879279 [Zychaea mexicana]|uniref:uncharacterized protein n=1 Tax=Zychaea mexicana TaxID=64656 RepID=UPI0022FF1577|nr:uncharacterized protein BDB00DRAFT_879279 [Zychaea mexicana]KAI9479560.1 hypothetical protein BDB00DRAFT_879279 [Zychaea mexicana]
MFVGQWNKDVLLAESPVAVTQYQPSVERWTCSCPAFLRSRFMICKHLARRSGSGRIVAKQHFIQRQSIAPFVRIRPVNTTHPSGDANDDEDDDEHNDDDDEVRHIDDGNWDIAPLIATTNAIHRRFSPSPSPLPTTAITASTATSHPTTPTLIDLTSNDDVFVVDQKEDHCAGSFTCRRIDQSNVH